MRRAGVVERDQLAVEHKAGRSSRSSGTRSLMSQARRLRIWRPSSVETIARKPSYFSSNAQPSPDGMRRGSNIGRGRGRIPSRKLSRLTQSRPIGKARERQAEVIGEPSRSGQPVSLDRLGHGLDGRAYPSAISRSVFEIPRATRTVPLLPACAAGRVLLLGEAGRDRATMNESVLVSMGREQPSVRLEEVGWPAFVLVAPVGHDGDKVGSGARGERERATTPGATVRTPPTLPWR